MNKSTFARTMNTAQQTPPEACQPSNPTPARAKSQPIYREQVFALLERFWSAADAVVTSEMEDKDTLIVKA